MASAIESDVDSRFAAGIGSGAGTGPDRPMPAGYASTLAPFAIALAETGEVSTFVVRDGWIEVRPGAETAATCVELSQASFDGLRRDVESAAGLIYGRTLRARGGAQAGRRDVR